MRYEKTKIRRKLGFGQLSCRRPTRPSRSPLRRCSCSLESRIGKARSLVSAGHGAEGGRSSFSECGWDFCCSSFEKSHSASVCGFCLLHCACSKALLFCCSVVWSFGSALLLPMAESMGTRTAKSNLGKRRRLVSFRAPTETKGTSQI